MYMQWTPRGLVVRAALGKGALYSGIGCVSLIVVIGVCRTVGGWFVPSHRPAPTPISVTTPPLSQPYDPIGVLKNDPPPAADATPPKPVTPLWTDTKVQDQQNENRRRQEQAAAAAERDRIAKQQADERARIADAATAERHRFADQMAEERARATPNRQTSYTTTSVQPSWGGVLTPSIPPSSPKTLVRPIEPARPLDNRSSSYRTTSVQPSWGGGSTKSLPPATPLPSARPIEPARPLDNR